MLPTRLWIIFALFAVLAMLFSCGKNDSVRTFDLDPVHDREAE